MKTSKNNRELKAIRKAILDVFGGLLSYSQRTPEEIIDGCTYLGSEDPGGWAHGAVAVVHLDDGLPSGEYSIDALEKWFEITRLLNERGHDLFNEPVNAGVVAFYNA